MSKNGLRQQANLEALVEKATKNEVNLLNIANFCENSKIQPEDNIPRWILLPNDELFYSNGRLVKDTTDIPESSSMGELRNNKNVPRGDGQLVCNFQMEVVIENPLGDLLPPFLRMIVQQIQTRLPLNFLYVFNSQPFLIKE